MGEAPDRSVLRELRQELASMREGAELLTREREEAGSSLARAQKEAEEASGEVARLTAAGEKLKEEVSSLKAENSSLKSENAKLKSRRASEAETLDRKVKEATASLERELRASIEDGEKLREVYRRSVEGSNKQLREWQERVQSRERLATEALTARRRAEKERDEEAQRHIAEKIRLVRELDVKSQQLVEAGAQKEAEEARAVMAERALEEDKHQAQEEAVSRFVQSSRMASWVNWTVMFRIGTLMAQVRQIHPGFRLARPLDGLIPSTPPPYTPPRLGFFVDDEDCPFDAWDASAVPESVRMSPGKKLSDLGDPLCVLKERCRKVLEEHRAAAEAERVAQEGEIAQEGDAVAQEEIVQEEDVVEGAS